jgi:predicted RNA-binding protein with TRAM domain
MVDVPDSLRTLYSATVDSAGDSYSIEVPASEVEDGSLDVDEQYRVALLQLPESQKEPGELQHSAHQHPPGSANDSPPVDPPVDEGEILEVEISDIGDEGDGLARLDGFVVFVPGGKPGDRLTVRIQKVKTTVAHAIPVNGRES